MQQCRGCHDDFPAGKAMRLHLARCDDIKKQHSNVLARAQAAMRKDGEARLLKRQQDQEGDSSAAKRIRSDNLGDLTYEEDVPMDMNEHVDIDPTGDETPVHDDIEPGPAMAAPRYNLRRRAPPIVQDVTPRGPAPVLDDEEAIAQEPDVQAQPANPPLQATVLDTKPNVFGVWRRYAYRPERDPAHLADPESFLVPKLLPPVPHSSAERDVRLVVPDDSATANYQRLLAWQTSGTGTKSLADTEVLVDTVLRHPGFNPKAFQDNAWKRAFKAEGAFRGDSDDWRQASFTIDIPIAKRYRSLAVNNGAKSAPFVIDDFNYRPLCGFIKALAEKDPAASRFIYTPYEEFVRLAEGTDVPLHGEMYATPEWRAEHERVQHLQIPQEKEQDGGKLPRALFVLMFGSDETLLAQFGSASAWPCYGMAGNQTKYERARPSMHAIHQIAFFVKLPDAVQDFIKTRQGGAAAKRALLTFCKREAMQASWKILLDDDFLEAYEWGMVVDCADGVKRLLFPRIFTYTADYPEKCIIATIKDLGNCPCPRCLVTKEEIPKAGQRLDMRRRTTKARTDDAARRRKVESARKVIYEHGYTVDSKSLDPMLKDESLTPNQNAFSDRLGALLFDLFRMLVVDLLHEFEIGVWKAIFTHMLRILQAHDKELLAELNKRFRNLSTFGRATIRKFHNNVSEMKRLGARDFEDILQCAIAAFDKLLPPVLDKLFMDLLFTAAEWHALAKLRLHSDDTLAGFSTATTTLMDMLRRFEQETADIDTKELERENRARQRRATAANPAGGQTSSGPQTRHFNLSTYKIHVLPDYVPFIKRLGTTDSWTSRLFESAHRVVKRANRSTNHHNQVAQLAASEQRARRIRTRTGGTAVQKQAADTAPSASPDASYDIAKDSKHPVHVAHFTRDLAGDPATREFFEQLKSHLLERTGVSPDLPDDRYSEDLRMTITIENNRLYRHRTMRVNYTTYDMRRSQDSLNPHSAHRDIMMISPEERPNAHPYWYARILDIFHVNVVRVTALRPEPPKRFDVLWIRWFGEDPQWHDGWKKRRLPRIGFVPASDPDAFGFIDPAAVVRACHLLPTYSEERTQDLLPVENSIARDDEETDDFVNYFVGIFADRDMVMRYRGGGVGHRFSLPPARNNRWIKTAALAPTNNQRPPQEDAHEDRQRPAGNPADEHPPPSYDITDDSDGEFDASDGPDEEDDLDDIFGAFDDPDTESESKSDSDSSADELGYDMDDDDANLDDDL